MLKALGLTTAMLFSFALRAQNDPNANVWFSVRPAIPVVITADLEMGPLQISAPWFAVQVWIDNKSNLPVTIIGALFNVTASQKNGATVTKLITVSPNQYNYTLQCSKGVTADIVFNDFGVFPSGTDGNLSLSDRSEKDLPQACRSLKTGLNPVIFYVGGLPQTDTNDHSYKVQMDLMGWFGTLQTPVSRLANPVSFITQ